MRSFRNLSTLFLTCAVLILNVSQVNAGIFFQDNFDNLSATWNNGAGTLRTPAGQEGSWTLGGAGTGSGTAEQICGASAASALKTLYPWAYYSGTFYYQTGPGTSMLFANPTADRNGGLAIQSPRVSGCANTYPGALDYVFSTNRQEIYLSIWIKFEAGYNKVFSAACKIPFYVSTSSNPIYIQYPSGSGFDQTNIKIYDSNNGLNGGSWWDTGITPALIYNDHAWHQLQFHLKFNSSASVADGAADAWIDGIHTATLTGQKFYTSGSRTLHDISIEQGNCSDESWGQTTWKSVWFDDVKISDTYIPYEVSGGAGGGSDTTPPIVTITSPTSNPTYSTSSSSVAVSGTASDNVAASSVKWACPTCTPTSGTATGTTSWSVSSIGLASGSNTITVTATDSSNNTSTSTLKVTSTQVVNGACGNASGQAFSSLNSGSSNLCATGTVASFSGSGPWTWGCNGSGGGTSTSSTTCSATLTTANLLLSEDFEDSSFNGRGWYDGNATSSTITASEHQSGSHAFICTFANGAQGCTNGSPSRHLFTASDTVYVDYYIKYASGWREQNGGAGHHELYLLTDADGDYSPLAFTHGTGYIEHWGTYGSTVPLSPTMTFQDGSNINQSQIGIDLTATSENRSVAGCNGLLDGAFFDYIDCYNGGGGTYYNGKMKHSPTASLSLNAWHHVQAYFKMNSVTANKGNADGTMAYWLDGVQQFRSDSILFRTNQYATMKFHQIIMGPYMGQGAPQSQSFYIDNLKVYDGISSSSTGPGSTTVTIQSVTNP